MSFRARSPLLVKDLRTGAPALQSHCASRIVRTGPEHTDDTIIIQWRRTVFREDGDRRPIRRVPRPAAGPIELINEGAQWPYQGKKLRCSLTAPISTTPQKPSVSTSITSDDLPT